MWVKICGLNRTDTAHSLLNLSKKGTAPDAIGLNFYAKSKRVVTREMAAKIVAILPESIEPVGLFVNHAANEIRDLCEDTGIRTIQLHGDESPEFIAELAEFNIIRAFRVGHEGLDDVARQLERFQQLGITMTRCIVDAMVPGAYGGTGHHAPWDLLRRDWQPDWPDLILAGGLTADNVTQAIETAHPKGVDVASGVELSPGVHDPEEIARFINQTRAAEKRTG